MRYPAAGRVGRKLAGADELPQGEDAAFPIALFPSCPSWYGLIRLADLAVIGRIVEVKGYSGTVVFDGQVITITWTGLGRLTVGKGQIRIPITSVTAVRWKPAGPLVNGYVHFSMLGSSDRRSRFGRQTQDVGHDENSVIFLRSQMPEFEKLRAAVETAIQRSGQPPVAVASIPEQIAQLAALRDQGILTEAELTVKKASLLSQI